MEWSSNRHGRRWEMLEFSKQRIPNGNFQFAILSRFPFADHGFDGVMAQTLAVHRISRAPCREVGARGKARCENRHRLFWNTAHSDFATVGAAA
ncbi:MAG: hypothetical protein IPP40_13125 [bacterium]|nr:hypothetical protein [bacterium]